MASHKIPDTHNIYCSIHYYIYAMQNSSDNALPLPYLAAQGSAPGMCNSIFNHFLPTSSRHNPQCVGYKQSWYNAHCLY